MGGGRHEFAVPKPSFNLLEFLKLAATCPPSLPSESLPSVSNPVVVERDLPDRRINVRLNIAFATKKKDPPFDDGVRDRLGRDICGMGRTRGGGRRKGDGRGMDDVARPGASIISRSRARDRVIG